MSSSDPGPAAPGSLPASTPPQEAPRTVQVMLASSGGVPDDATLRRMTDSGEWLFDTKFDGVRAVAYVDKGALTLANRRERDTTARYPDLVQAVAAQLAGRRLVLDGEIIVLDHGTPSWPLIHQRDALSSPLQIRHYARTHPATYVAFDLLEIDGEDLRRRPLAERLHILHEQVPLVAPLRHSITADDGTLLWDQVQRLGLEGIIAKRRDSLWVPRRSPTWVKFKATRRLSAIVVGMTAGTGGRAATFGALRLALYDGGQLVDIGEVGSGFSQQMLERLLPRLRAGERFVVEIEYQERSPTGALRFPVFKQVRQDVTLAECTTDQFTEGG